jgi:hypothetical protein
MARTAVVAGTATAVSNRVSRRQANRWAEQGEAQPAYMQPGYAPAPSGYAPAPPPPAYAPAPAAPAAPSTEDKFEQLRQLGELKTSGILTEAEFEAQKAKILAS